MLFRLARLALSLGSARFGELRAHTGRRVVYSSLLGFFGLIALVFGLIAATVALTQQVGLLYALLIMTGLALLGCLVTIILMNLAERKHRQVALEQNEMQARLQQLAMMGLASGFGGGRPGLGKALGIGVVGLAALLALGSATRRRGD
ncbi:MAG: hypothetical protein DI556_03145 [Rhodovulum sulfidophilum]|uniref:Uncharacterized protein n=1 Tax=Rhodovulum sulfidophilum TaxID=35806 RepID=A0A2W5QD45_RHOSU|nr:MAG: hypothetical protein DI556_03145 [Rhodovulum sulfidophilum]